MTYLLLSFYLASFITVIIITTRLIWQNKYTNDLLFFTFTNAILIVTAMVFYCHFSDYFLCYITCIILLVNTSLSCYEIGKIKLKCFYFTLPYLISVASLSTAILYYHLIR